MNEANKAAIITEANGEIGTGHMYESIALAAEMLKNGYVPVFFANRDAPAPLLGQIPCPYNVYTDLNSEIDGISLRIAEQRCKAAVTNLRKIDNAVIGAIKAWGVSVICIDELGHRPLHSDVIINPLIDSYYHVYKDSDAAKCLGPKYMIMRPDFSESAQKTTPRKYIEELSVCMGGMDAPGITIKLLNWLSGKNIRLNLILGGGFSRHGELAQAMSLLNSEGITVYSNITNIAEIFSASDAVFCMGGNVLYELACLGVPALTIYEAAHEKASAEAFQERGFGFCIGSAEKVTKSEVEAALENLTYGERLSQSKNGKTIIDGKGLKRTLKILGGFYE